MLAGTARKRGREKNEGEKVLENKRIKVQAKNSKGAYRVERVKGYFSMASRASKNK